MLTDELVITCDTLLRCEWSYLESMCGRVRYVSSAV